MWPTLISNIIFSFVLITNSTSLNEFRKWLDICTISLDFEKPFVVPLGNFFDQPDILLNYQQSDHEHIVFIETSGRNHLLIRQTCAIESAGRQNPNSPVIILMNSTELNLEANNATFQLYQLKDSLNLNFYSISNWDAVVKDTPLEDENIKYRVLSSSNRINHVSDAFRLAVIYKIGGWYFDIDTIHMKNLDEFKHRNVFSTDVESLTDSVTGLKTLVGNGVFHIVKNESQFLWNVMNYFKKQYSPHLWASGGSTIFTKAFREACNINPHQYGYSHLTGGPYNPSQCQGLELVDSKYFFPFPWTKASDIITQRKSLKEWEEIFKDAYSADFFASSVMGSSKTRVQRAQFYGRQKPAFLYLGPKYCPTSYFSAELF